MREKIITKYTLFLMFGKWIYHIVWQPRIFQLRATQSSTKEQVITMRWGNARLYFKGSYWNG